jgi:type II secretory pathway pseudopilin PulG
MRTHGSERGYTLIENMVAIGIVVLGAAGLSATFLQGVNMTGDARRMTQATAIAQDLLNNISTWPYQDNVSGTPLANTSTSNDADIADTAHAFETTANPVASGLADHGETDLPALWTGIPTGAPQLTGFERYWNVVYIDTNGNGVNDLVQIAVIVRWQQGGNYRRVVLVTAKLNPQGS